MDGFDHYYITNDVGFTGGAAATGQKWDAQFSNGVMYPRLDSGRFGGRALLIRTSGGGGSITKNIDTPNGEMIVGFALFLAPTSVHTTRVTFTNSLGAAINCDINAVTGLIEVDRAGTPLATSTAVLNNGLWQYIEFRVLEDNVAGEVEVKLNGSTVVTATGLNTGASSGLLTHLVVAATSNLQLDYIDDLYLIDTTGATNNTFLGDSRITTLPTLSNGATNDFTLFDDGTQSYSPIFINSEAVRNGEDATIGRDHNYVESGLIGAREIYNTVAFTETPITIHGVQVVTNARKTSTGVLKYRDEITIAGTQYDNGADITASTGDYQMSTFIHDTDPSDSAAWTVAKVNAVDIGFTITVREI
jgi:hypothetical protein